MAEMAPESMHKRRATACLFVVAGIVLAISLIGSGLALVDRFQKSDQRREEQAAVNRIVASQALQNCHEIELLKKAQRQQAIDNYSKLARNAKLLGIKLTPQLRKASLDQRNHILAVYAPEVCPRPVKKIAHSKP